jgi:hypothetical protein
MPKADCVFSTPPKNAPPLSPAERFEHNAQTFVECVGSTLVYVGVADRKTFDEIAAPCRDAGENDDGHVLVKQIGNHGEDEVTVIFQHWIKSRTLNALIADRQAETSGRAQSPTKPAFPEPASPASAPGASPACQAAVIPDSRPDASQALSNQIERRDPNPTCSSGAAASMTRRNLMNSIVALPIAAAVPVAMPAMSVPDPTHDHPLAVLARAEQMVDILRARTASDSFTFDEVAAERALRYFRRRTEGAPVDETEVSAAWDFLRAHGQYPDWIFYGSPSSMISSAAWSSPARQPQADANADARLIELEEKIFELIHAMDEFEPEMSRLQQVWTSESIRLYNEVQYGSSTLSAKDRSAIINAMPECIEHTRLCNLVQRQDDEAQLLVKQMWAIPAKTPEGRRAKFFVLLAYFMPEKWSEASDIDADCDIEYARRLMIEMIGGEPAEQLRDQFAA